MQSCRHLLVFWGIVPALLVGCARQSQTRSNSDSVKKSASEVSNKKEDGESISNADGKPAAELLSPEDIEAARNKLKEKDLGKLSLEEQCSVYGEGWEFDAAEQKCYKPGSEQTAEDICKGKGEGWILIEKTGECTKPAETLALSDACKARGDSWAYDDTEKVCYEVVGGSETSLESACSDKSAGSNSDVSLWDSATKLCTTYTDISTPEGYCTGVLNGTWDAVASSCTLADGTVLSRDELIKYAGEHPQEGWVYDPVTGTFRKIKEIVNSEDLCATSDGVRFHAEKEVCVSVQDLLAAEKVCEDKGESWEYDTVKNECVKAENSVSVQEVCEAQGKSCLYNPVTGKWEVVLAEVTTKALCDDRGPGWTFLGEKSLCVPSGKNELTALGGGVFQDADGKKYQNVLELGKGYAVGSYYGFGVPQVACDENSWKSKLKVNVSWWWVGEVPWEWQWNYRLYDPEYYRLCGPEAMKYTAEENEDLECPQGYMVESISAQANLLNGYRFLNYIKIKCINFDKRSQGLKAGFSNDESSLPVIRCGGFNDVITGIKMTKKTYIKNFELECAPLDMDKLVNGLEPVNLELPLFTGDYLFNFDTVGDVYRGKSCNSPHGTKNRVLTGLKIRKARVTGWIGKGNDRAYKQEWVAYSIQTVCGTLSRKSVLLNN